MIEKTAQAILNDLGRPETELSILIVDDPFITHLNKKYFNRDRPTNVIAFPMQEGEFAEISPQVLGDVVISIDTAKIEAETAGITTEERFYQLLVHGILHLFGYDHVTEKELFIMDEKSDELLLKAEKGTGLKSNRIYPKVFFAFICLFLIFPTSYVFAHRVTIFAWVKGDSIYTESKFSGGKKAKGATVEVYDEQGRRLVEGKTDRQGNFSFKIPKKAILKIVLIAGMGHKNHWIIEAEEITDSISGQSSAKQDHEPDSQSIPFAKSVSSDSKNALYQDQAPWIEIQLAFEKAIDKKIQPIIRKLSNLEQKDNRIKPTEIIGGIGYILGLFGIAAYFAQKRKTLK
jgi:nickel transport protein